MFHINVLLSTTTVHLNIRTLQVQFQKTTINCRILQTANQQNIGEISSLEFVVFLSRRNTTTALKAAILAELSKVPMYQIAILYFLTLHSHWDEVRFSAQLSFNNSEGISGKMSGKVSEWSSEEIFVIAADKLIRELSG